VDASFQVLRRSYAQFVMLMGIAYVPWLVLTMLTMRTIFADPASGTLGPSIGRTLLMAVGGLIWFSIIDGAMTVAASQSYLGRSVDVGDAFQRAFGRIGSLVAVAVVRSLIIGLGFLFFIVPGFYFLARFFAAPAAVVLEQVGMGRALGRSSTLSDGHKGHVLKTLLLVWIIYLALTIALGAMVGWLVQVAGLGSVADPSALPIMQIVSALFTILIYPLVGILQTLLYYDLRIRKEGYDIELMAGEIARPVGQPAY
jgi:hypothetical protein